MKSISEDDVLAMLRKQATGYIAARTCTFDIERDDHRQGWMMVMVTADGRIAKRPVPPFTENNHYEVLDLAMVMLTHMAVLCGLIETTPKNLTHNITITGEDWSNTEIQLDGHTLRGVYSVDYTITAGEEPRMTMCFARNAIHLDKDFLPEHLHVNVEGMDTCLELLRAVADNRREQYANEETGEQYAKLTSSDEEMNLFRDVYNALRMYEPSEDVAQINHEAMPESDNETKH